jgi:hypothetical protein
VDQIDVEVPVVVLSRVSCWYRTQYRHSLQPQTLSQSQAKTQT